MGETDMFALVVSTKQDTKKVKKTAVPASRTYGGLKKNWRDVVGATTTRSSAAVPSASRHSASNAPVESSDDDGVKFGGYIEDDDGLVERKALKSEARTGGGKGKAGSSVKRETAQVRCWSLPFRL